MQLHAPVVTDKKGATRKAVPPARVLDPETNFLYVSSTTVIEAMALFAGPEVSDMNYVAWWTGGFGSGQGGPQGLPLAKPPWGRITAINLNTGGHVWMMANADAPDWVKNNPALKGIKLPRTGRPDRVGMLVTKTLLFAGEGAGLYGSAGGGGNKFRAHDKATGEIISEMELPANQSGLPMTYSINWKTIHCCRGRRYGSSRRAGCPSIEMRAGMFWIVD